MSLTRWKLRIRQLYLEVIYRRGVKKPAPDGLFRLDTGGKDETKLDDDISVMTLSKVDSKAFATSNEDDPDSEKPASYPKMNSNDDLISRDAFLREKSFRPACQQYSSYVLKAHSNISYDSERYLVRFVLLHVAIQQNVPTNFTNAFSAVAITPVYKATLVRHICFSCYEGNYIGVSWPIMFLKPYVTSRPVELVEER